MMETTAHAVRTNVLEIAYETAGPDDGPPVLLLHGWPDDVRGWDGIVPKLAAAGYRTIAPYLRGFGPTTFLDSGTYRDGRGVAITQDALDLADALSLERFAVVGHDWGARSAYLLAAAAPRRVTSIAALSTIFAPRNAFVTPASLAQVRAYWYQWFMCTDGGVLAVHRDPKAFAREQWETWSPPGWFDEAAFEITAKSFLNTDWPDVTLNSYRNRWISEAVDAKFELLALQLAEIETLSVPALLVMGADDRCTLPASTDGQEKYFTGKFERVMLEGVGHFPAREAPDAVAEAVLAHLRS